MTEAYCGDCERRTTTELLPHGRDDLIKVCGRCESAYLFPEKAAYIANVHERVMRTVTCDHKFEAGEHHLSTAGECDYCGRADDDPLVQYSLDN